MLLIVSAKSEQGFLTVLQWYTKADLATAKAEREADKLTVERLEREIIGLGGKDVDHSNNSSELAVMRQVLEDIQNQNHSLREQISSLSERDIRTAHPHSMDDVISPKM